jgi:hypothetical protein
MWPGASAFYNLYEIPYKNWRQLPLESVPNNNRQNIETLLYADYHGLITESEDNLQLPLQNHYKIAKIYDI